MRIRQSKGNGNYKINLNEKEFVTLTVALANLDAEQVIKDSEDEGANLTVDASEVINQSVSMFEEFSKLADMYNYDTESK